MMEHEGSTIVLHAAPNDRLANEMLIELVRKVDRLSETSVVLASRMTSIERTLQASATNIPAPRMIGRWTSTEFVLLAGMATLIFVTIGGAVIVLTLNGHEDAAIGILEKIVGLGG